MKKLIFTLTVIILVTACSKPFLVGKNHYMVLGPNKQNKPSLVKVISVTTDPYNYIDVIYVTKNGDTCGISGLTQLEFKQKFKLK